MTPSWERVKRDGYLPISSAYTNVVNQRLAFPVTYLAWRLGLTPNHLTAGSALLTAGALLVMTLAAPVALPGAAVAFTMLSTAYVLDSADGQLARVAGLGSRFGAVFDHLVDGAKILAVNLCFGWVLVDRADLRFGYLAMALNIFGQGMIFFGWELKTARYGAKLSRTLHEPALRVRLLSLPFDVLDWGLFVGFAWLLPWPRLLLQAYLLYGCGCMLTAVAYILHSGALMRRADAVERTGQRSRESAG